VAIIGGGIIGASIARELSRYKLRVILVEKEADIAFGGSTKANTGIIHAGYDDAPGTLKARLCVRGNALWPRLAAELEVPFERVGSLVVALRDEEVRTLVELKRRGEANSVPCLEMIEDRGRLLDMEPGLNKEVVAALYAPTAGIASPYEMAIAMAENAAKNGAHIVLQTKVTKVVLKAGEVRGVQTDKGPIEAGYVINAAGLFSDEISATAGISRFKIVPKKGEYFVFDKALSDLVRHVLFPIPTQVSKGIVVTRTVDGNLLVGPNANSVDDKTDSATTSGSLEEVFAGATRLVPQLSSQRGMIIANYAGLRAESNTEDFIVEAYEEPRGFVNVAGIKSPGLTAAPAIAEMVASILEEAGLELREKVSFCPHRRSIDRSVRQHSTPKAEKLIAGDPMWGHVVCRCEQATEGEVVEAIKRGATTLDGVKYRTRAGMGRCQGGFCTPHIIRILSRELGIPVTEVTKHGGNSRILPYEVKTLLRKGRR